MTVLLASKSERDALAKMVALASSMGPDAFMRLLYEVAADMAEDGVSLDVLAVLCETVCKELASTGSLATH